VLWTVLFGAKLTPPSPSTADLAHFVERRHPLRTRSLFYGAALIAVLAIVALVLWPRGESTGDRAPSQAETRTTDTPVKRASSPPRDPGVTRPHAARPELSPPTDAGPAYAGRRQPRQINVVTVLAVRRALSPIVARCRATGGFEASTPKATLDVTLTVRIEARRLRVLATDMAVTGGRDRGLVACVETAARKLVLETAGHPDVTRFPIVHKFPLRPAPGR
jgi:hypothetical protein